MAATQIDRLDFFSRFAAPYFALGAGLLVMVSPCREFFPWQLRAGHAFRVLSEPLVTYR